ncbi:MAG: TetR/AcrR family transcriptional regulator [Actinobacteria bacterium]|nr:TetR/AcrR family transcriptional regulator [Actinomycetota bacterium]
MSPPPAVDRAAAIRRALRDLVAERGFHGASMSAVAEAAGVAVGTAYVHYASKEDLVYATYLEIKRDLGAAVLASLDTAAAPRERYAAIWRAVYGHLRSEPQRARFLTQLEESPFHAEAHRRLLEEGDVLMDQASDPGLAALLVPLPVEVLSSLSLGTAVRLASAGVELDENQIAVLVASTWRAITVEAAAS